MESGDSIASAASQDRWAVYGRERCFTGSVGVNGMDMVKAGVIGVVGVLLAVSFKSHKAEYGAYVALAVCFVMLEYIMRYFMQILSGMEMLRGYLKDNYSYLALLLKAVGATYACEFCAGICKDAGYAGVAGQVEMLGKLYILSMGMPVLFSLMESIQLMGG